MFVRLQQISRLSAVAALLGVLAGCQAIVSNPPMAQLRVINASPDAPGLDIYQGSSALAYNLGFGTVTSYIPLVPAVATITADAAGSRQILTSAKVSLAASAQYTALIGDSTASLQQVMLTDQSQPAPAGQIALRFIDQAIRMGAVDIYLVPSGKALTAVAPLVTGIGFGVNTGYLNIAAGTYTVVMVSTSVLPARTTVAIYTGSQITYAGGAARTIILIDQQLVTAPGLQVITAADYDSPATT